MGTDELVTGGDVDDPSVDSVSTDRLLSATTAYDYILFTDRNGDYVLVDDSNEIDSSSTDAGPLIETAINGSFKGSDGPSVKILTGNYTIETTATATQAFTLEGCGRNRTKIVSDGNEVTNGIEDSSQNAINEYRWIKFTGINSPRSHLKISPNELNIDYCEFRDTNAYSIDISAPGSYTQVNNCWFLTSDINRGPLFNSVNELIFTNNFVRNSVRLRGSDRATISNNIFSGSLESDRNTKIYLPSSNDGLVSIQDNIFDIQNGSGQIIRGVSALSSQERRDWIFEGNHFFDNTGNSLTGIRVDENITDVVISGNIFGPNLGSAVDYGSNATAYVKDNRGHNDPDETGDGMTANPESDTEDGFLPFEWNGTTYHIPIYQS